MLKRFNCSSAFVIGFAIMSKKLSGTVTSFIVQELTHRGGTGQQQGLFGIRRDQKQWKP